VRPPLLVLDRAGLPIALEAWRLLRARLGDAAPGLAVAGESSPAPAGVTFLGALAPGEVPAALAGAQALLCCSPLEPSGAQALAALAAGVPVVALPLGAVPEVLGDAGLIALGLSPAALARRLEELGQPGVGAALAARGRKRASGFTWALAAERTLAVYDAVARAPAQPSLRARQALADLVGAFSAAS
jgi:glycosyltransferase involved in cell wall biosynthesis